MSFSKVIVFLLACLILNCESIAINKDSYLKALDNSRMSNAQRRGEIFFSGLYNKDGNGGGADFGLTSDVYTKPNPYHTKNKMVEKKPEPIYYPAVNAVDNNMASSSSNYDAQSSTGYSYELPAANYGSSGPTGSDTTSYNSAENSHSSSDSTHSPSFGFPAHTYGASASTYGSPVPTQGAPVSNYGAPVYNYGASAPTHLAPVSNYGASAYNYGAPAQSYGTPHSAYGVPASYYPAPLMEMPMHAQKSSASHWLLTKIFKKFDLIVMSKILLKLIIFKKIVKFIGIICLLLFIPTLKKKFSDETDEERSQYSKLDAYGKVDLRVKEIANFALTAIEGFSYDEIPWCVGQGIFCRLQYMFDTIDSRYPGDRILRIWLPELQTTTTQAPMTTQRSDFDEGTVDFNEFITENPISSETIEDHNAINLHSNEI